MDAGATGGASGAIVGSDTASGVLAPSSGCGSVCGGTVGGTSSASLGSGTNDSLPQLGHRSVAPALRSGTAMAREQLGQAIEDMGPILWSGPTVLQPPYPPVPSPATKYLSLRPPHRPP